MRTLRSRPIDERFWEKVVKRDPESCWNWCAATIKGYGSIGDGKGGTVLAHRLSIELHTGVPVPRGTYVMHSCDNPRCVNPAHLFLGSAQDNATDAMTKGRTVSGKSKLSDIDVAEIHRLSKSGLSNLKIAEKFGVQQPAICKVLRGKTPRYMRLKIQHDIAAQRGN